MSLYTEQFFDTIAQGCQKSASIVVPLILKRFPAETVVDVGCGQGWWGGEFKKRGCHVTGIDGDYTTPAEGNLDQFLPADLTGEIPAVTADLAVCLEVAEHLPEDSADHLIDALTSISEVVVFSAAIPFQTGAGHINCQWQSYWVEKFQSRGYTCTWDIRDAIWNDPRVEAWYSQNLFIATKKKRAASRTPCDVVHPTLHYWGRT